MLINPARPSPVFQSPGRAHSPPPLPSPPPSSLTTCSWRRPPPPARPSARPRRFSRAARAPPRRSRPFTSAELLSRSRWPPRPASQPLRTPASPARLPAPRPPRSSASRAAPREDFRGGPGPADADWWPPGRPAPRARAGGGADPTWARARRGPESEASVTRVPGPGVRGQATARWGRAAAGRSGAGVLTWRRRPPQAPAAPPSRASRRGWELPKGPSSSPAR